MRVNRRKWRRGIAIQYIILLVVGILVAAIVGYVMLSMAGGSSVPASLSVIARAKAKPGGALMTVTVQNTGTVGARVVAVLVEGPGVSGASAVDSTLNIQVGTTSGTPSLSNYQNTGGFVLGGGEVRNIQIDVQGVTSGTKLTVYVVYYDTSSGVGNVEVASCVVA